MDLDAFETRACGVHREAEQKRANPFNSRSCVCTQCLVKHRTKHEIKEENQYLFANQGMGLIPSWTIPRQCATEASKQRNTWQRKKTIRNSQWLKEAAEKVLGKSLARKDATMFDQEHLGLLRTRMSSHFFLLTILKSKVLFEHIKIVSIHQGI